MTEFPGIRQDQDSFKRYFFDDELDLYLWYDKTGDHLTGFQLIYDKRATPKAFTWLKDKGYRHDEVDGSDNSWYNQTPILVADGVFPSRRIADLFVAHADGVPQAAVRTVLEILNGYSSNGEMKTI